MNETNDQQPEEQVPKDASAQPAQVSDDVSEIVEPVKSDVLAADDVTGDVSEAIDTATSEPSEVSAASEASEPFEGSEASEASTEGKSGARRGRDQDPKFELRQLMELAVKYPEIGPPLAELAFKIGHNDIGQRIVSMGLDDDESTGVEYYAVAIDVARREGRFEDVFSQVEDALKTFAETADDAITEDEANRLLHLVRNGFAVLLFDLEDVNAKPEWTRSLSEQLPRLETRYADDPFFYSLLAQAHWFTDPAKSEETWERAVELSHDDFAWNARGTWYKDALKDFGRRDELVIASTVFFPLRKAPNIGEISSLVRGCLLAHRWAATASGRPSALRATETRSRRSMSRAPSSIQSTRGTAGSQAGPSTAKASKPFLPSAHLHSENHDEDRQRQEDNSDDGKSRLLDRFHHHSPR